jgi:hypothetical protein
MECCDVTLVNGMRPRQLVSQCVETCAFKYQILILPFIGDII